MPSANSTHLVDVVADRALGAYWERQFCRLAATQRKAFTPQQIGREKAASWFCKDDADQWRTTLLPDVTVWTCPGEHHEIKHKAPTRAGCFGLEKYRLDALLDFQSETQQYVLYTIHDWQCAGALESRAAMPNKLEHWITADILMLEKYIHTRRIQPVTFSTYVNGKPATRPGYYWPQSLWMPLDLWWNPW